MYLDSQCLELGLSAVKIPLPLFLLSSLPLFAFILPNRNEFSLCD